MDEVVHLVAEHVVLLGQAFREVLLVDDLLRRLVAVKSQSPARTLHNDSWAEAAQYARLVVF